MHWQLCPTVIPSSESRTKFTQSLHSLRSTILLSTKWRRFVANGGAVNGALQISDLLNQFLFAATANLGISYVRAIRIRRIRILSPVTTQGTSVSLRLQPVTNDSNNNSFVSIPETYIDTSASIDVPAYIELSPSIQSPLGAWHYSTNTTAIQLVLITCPAGTTMDIAFDYILNHENVASVYTQSIVGVQGTMFSRSILTNFMPLVLNVY
jgi:hypothetical protein